MNVVLASGSPRRKELLEMLGVKDLKIIPAQGEEKAPEGVGPGELVMALASAKANEVRKLCAPDDVIIAADTIVWFEERVYGKPHSRDEAIAMLTKLSGNSHRVYTGVAFCRDKKELSSFVQCTEVDFYPLTEEQIRRYLKTGEPFDKAGAYGIQGKGSLFVKELRGDYFNVVGFPVARVARELESLSCADGFPAWI